MATATYDDVSLMLRLYELRRESRLREARSFMTFKFKAPTLDEFWKVCPIGSEENASYRMVVSYWEMVASFITSGVLNQELFFQSGYELLFAWEKIKDIVPQMRENFKNPNALKNLEAVAQAYAHHMGADAYAAFSARARGLSSQPSEAPKT